MKKKNYELRIMNYILSLLVISIIHNSYFILPTHAASPTPKASPMASTNPAPDPLKQKIEDLKKEIASKAADLKMEVNKKLQNKAVAGSIQSKTDKEIILKTPKKTQTVLIDEYTQFQDKSKTFKKTLTLKILVNNEYIVALGDMDDKNNLVAKKIIKLDPPKPDTKKFYWGKIQSVQGSTLTFLDSENKSNNLILANPSIFLGTEEASNIDLKPEKFFAAIAMGTQTKYIYLIPQEGFIKPEKVASPSATATSSAKPKVSPKPSPSKK